MSLGIPVPACRIIPDLVVASSVLYDVIRVCFSGGSFSGTGQGDMAEITRLQQEIDAKKQEIEEKNSQIETLVSMKE